MKNNESVLDADLSYAMRMVQGGFSTAEQAARTCGVSLVLLQAQLSGPDRCDINRGTARVH